MRQQTAVGLDVGTTKICAIVGREEADGRTGIVAVGAAPSLGLRKGIVVDTTLATRSIEQALRAVHDSTGEKVRSVYVGIAGGHIKGFAGSGAVAVKGGVVREEDVDRLLDAAGAVYVPVDREILHVIPTGFRLNGRNRVIDPVGLRGERLEGDVHIVTGSVTSVQNLIACCEQAGVEVLDIVLQPLASAESVLTEAERRDGVVLVDIGGGTTDVALYRDKMLRHTAVLAIGGNHLTNDISVGLGVPAADAENLKKDYGTVIGPEGTGLPEVVTIGRPEEKREVPLQYLTGIIQARCEELLGLVRKEMEAISFRLGTATVVLTGGTSLLRGIREFAGGLFGLPVRIGMPGGVIDSRLVHSPIYATGVGLVRYGLQHTSGPELRTEGIIESMKRWVTGFLNR